MLLGCLERVTGESVALDPRFTAGAPGSGGAVVQHDPNAGPATPFSERDGPTIVVRGEITGERPGPVDLDLLVPDPNGPGGVSQVGKILLDAPGPFELQVPAELGVLHLMAFQDVGEPGPSDQDPFAAISLKISDDDVDAPPLTLVVGARSGAVFSSARSSVFADHEGEWTTLWGLVVAPSDQGVGVDLRAPDPNSQTGDALLGREFLGAPGPYELIVPRGYGPLTLQFSQDVAGDGPDPSDAFFSLSVDIGDDARLEHDVELVAGGFGSIAPGGGGAPGPQGGSPFGDLGARPITISGTLVVPEGMDDAIVDVDLYTVDAQGHGGRTFVGKIKASPGAFSFQAPRNLGQLLLEAAIDPDMDGPTAGDPKAECPCNPLNVGSTDIGDLEFVLQAQ